MLLYYKDFIQEGSENNIKVPNNTDNLATIKTDPAFKQANKIPAPEVNTNIEPTQVLDFQKFIELYKENPELNINQYHDNKIKF